jgi:uncharacterized membrane protein YjjB (DUF3815 family)
MRTPPGGGREVMVASVLGLSLGLVGLFPAAQPRLSRVFEPLAAFFVSVAAVGLAYAVGPVSVLVATIAGLIVLMPGLTLTTAMTELVTRHLASGTARLRGAFITFLAIAFGVALGNRVGGVMFSSPTVATPVPPPTWLRWWRRHSASSSSCERSCATRHGSSPRGRSA